MSRVFAYDKLEDTKVRVKELRSPLRTQQMSVVDGRNSVDARKEKPAHAAK